MKSRTLWLVLLIALCGIVILKGSARTARFAHIATETQAPRGGQDSSWQAASQIAAFDDSTSQGARHHPQSIVFTSDLTRPQIGDYVRRCLAGTLLDHSPTHPIPLLI